MEPFKPRTPQNKGVVHAGCYHCCFIIAPLMSGPAERSALGWRLRFCQDTSASDGSPGLAGGSQQGAASRASFLSSVGLIWGPRLWHAPTPGRRPREAGASQGHNFPAWRGPSLTPPCSQRARKVMARPGIHHRKRPRGARVPQSRAGNAALKGENGCLVGINDSCRT